MKDIARLNKLIYGSSCEFLIECGFMHSSIQGKVLVSLICICYIGFKNRVESKVFSPRDNNAGHYEYLSNALISEEISNPFYINTKKRPEYCHYICFSSGNGVSFKRVKK